LPESFVRSHIMAKNTENIEIHFPDEERAYMYSNLSPHAQACGIIFLILIFFCMACTMTHVIWLKVFADDPSDDPPNRVKYARFFSLHYNMGQLMNGEDKTFLRVLNGGRFISLIWIFVANNGYVHARDSIIFNIERVASMFDNYDILSISYGSFFGYDSLFAFSGMMLGYIFLDGVIA
jgi:hypothetical protein